MKKHFFLLPAVLFFSGLLHAQDDVDAIKANWYDKKYDKVIELTDVYYKKNKRSLTLDLIKVSSMCMLGVNLPNPKLCFDYISQAYKIPPEVKTNIQKARNNCSSLDLESVSNYVRTSSNEPPRTVGKIGRSTLQEELERRGDTAKVIRNFSPEELRKRLVKLKSVKLPVFYRQFFDSVGIRNWKIKVFGKFVLVHANLAFDNNSFWNMQSRLDTYYNFFVQEFNMKEPQEYITVFLAQDINELKHFSEKLHGFIPPSYTLGYSSLEDQTIVAIAYVPDKPLLGTTCHELFHILSKNTFETLPAWLEEGMASLYEVSQPNGNAVTGLNSGGIEFLLDNPHHRNRKLQDFPVKKIIGMGWDEFNQTDSEGEAFQSFHYSYSRYLMFYLQEKGKLAAFFKDAANYSYMDIKADPVNDYLLMIAKYTGDTEDFDENFKRWVETKPLISHQ